MTRCGGATSYDRSRNWSVSSAGPFTATLVAASNLSVGSGVVVIVSSRAHLTASARFRTGPPGSVSGRLCETTAWRRRPSCPDFPSRFRCRRSLLGHPMPAEEFGSPHGRPTGHARGRAGPRRGYRVPHARAATGVGALYTPGTAVLLPAEARARPAPAALRRPVPDDPVPALHPRECALRGIDESSSNSPVRSSPRPRPPGWNGPPLRLPPEASAPRRPGADDARQGRGQAVEHGPGTTRSTSHPLILQSVVHSFRATSRRTAHCASGGVRASSCRASRVPTSCLCIVFAP